MKRLLTCSCLGLGAAGHAAAATVTWDGEGRTTNWSEAENWSGDARPGEFDEAVIPRGFRVVLDLPADIQSLDCQGSLTIPSAGVLEVFGPSTIRLGTLSGGAIIGLGTITITDDFTHESGDLGESGTLFVAPGATYTTTTNLPKSTFRSIENAGELVIQAPLNLGVPGGADLAAIVNQAGGELRLGAAITRTGIGEAVVENFGDLVVVAPPDDPAAIGTGVAFKHLAGGLTVTDGSRFDVFGGGVLKAPASIGAGGALFINSGEPGFDLEAGAAIAGPGQLELTGTVVVKGDASVGAPAVITGVIDGPADLTFAGDAAWRDGSMRGGGRTVNAPGSFFTLEQAGIGDLDLRRELVLEGDGQWTAGDIDLDDDGENIGVLLVDEAATLFLNADGGTLSGDVSGDEEFVAFGALVKTTPGVTSVAGNLPFTATGGMSINAGTLSVVSAQGVVGGGTSVQPDALLRFQHAQGGGVTFQDQAFIIGGGALELLGSFTAMGDVSLATTTAVLDGAIDGPGRVFIGNGDWDTVMTVPGAAFNGPGPLTVFDDAVLRITLGSTIARETDVAGVIDVDTNQQLTIAGGSSVTIEPFGELRLTAGVLAGSGAVQNGGTIRRDGDPAGSFVIGPNVVLDTADDAEIACEAGVLEIATRFGAAAGVVAIDPLGQVRFSGGDEADAHTLDGADIIGDGQMFVTGGRLALAGEVTVACTASHTGGDIGGADSDLIIDGFWSWSGGRLLGGNADGRVTINGVLSTFGSSDRVLSRRTDNFGTIEWIGGQINTFSGGVLTNHAEIVIDGGTDLLGNGELINLSTGSITKRSGGVTNLLFGGGFVNNLGLIRVEAGRLAITAEVFVNYDAGALIGGEYCILGNASIRHNGGPITSIIDASVALKGGGADFEQGDGASALVSLQSIALDSTYGVQHGGSGSTDAPLLQVDGVLELGELSIFAAAGDVQFGPNGAAGATVTFPAPEGPAGAASLLTVGGHATLDGSLILQTTGEADPPIGSVFSVIVAGTGVDGAFDALIAPPGPDGAAWRLVQTPVGVMLKLAPACEGDLTADLIVDSADLNVLLAAFGAGPDGDLDADGDTDSADLNILLAAFGDACRPGAGHAAGRDRSHTSQYDNISSIICSSSMKSSGLTR